MSPQYGTGLLIFGRDPARWLPQAELALARFEGRELGSDWIDRLEIRDALAFVRRNARLLCREEGIRQPMFQEFENEFVVTIYSRE